MKLSYNKFIKSGLWKFIIKILMPVIQIFTLALTAFLTYELTEANKESAKISEHGKNSAEFRTTREMCYDFNDRYWMYDLNIREKHSKDLDFLHLWTYPLWEWEINDSNLNIWENMHDTLKLKNLYSNIELNRVLDYFEDAKMMNEAKYLDEEYFYNFFVTTVRRLINTKNPDFIEYIDAKRNYNRDSVDLDSVGRGSVNVFIWDGFDYCLINIFIPQSKKKGNNSTHDQLERYWNDYLKVYERYRGKVKIEKINNSKDVVKNPEPTNANL
jgi:hypothetical protein